jgi:AbrB family looped-hinge helix DNA binding protein
MESSVLTSKGQIVIPKNIRKKYGIKPGTRILFVEKDGDITIRALTKEYFKSVAGWLKDGGDILDELMKEKKREIEHDEKRGI